VKLVFFLKTFTFFFFFLFMGLGCGSKTIIGTHPAPQKDTLLEASEPVRPKWITETPEKIGYKYFVGKGEKLEEKEAEKEAIIDMLERYAQFLGCDYRLLTEIHREEIAQKSDIYHTKGTVKTDAEILAEIITTGSEIRKRYWEKWGKISGKSVECFYYKYWVLGEVENRFIEEERERIKKLKSGEELRADIKPNSNLTVEVKADKETYKPGDTVKIYLEASDNCYAYILDFYGEGKTELLGEVILEKNSEYRLSGMIRYGGKSEEIIKVIVSDKPLNINEALKAIYPLAIIENLRQQKESLNARYAEKSITIFVVPK
jgi:hypothetical protein